MSYNDETTCTPGAGPSRGLPLNMPDIAQLSLHAHSSAIDSSESDEDGSDHAATSPLPDAKPPLFTANSAPPVLQTEYEGIKEGFSFGTCPSTSFVGTPAAEKGPFEYPDMTQSAGSSRRPSLAQPFLRRESSTSSTTSTITAFSSATRRPSLAPLPLPSALPSFQDGAQARRRGSMFHFQTKAVAAPIPPSLLARRGSLPAAEAIFGLPSTERRSHSRFSVSGAPHIPHSPPTIHSDRAENPPILPHRRASLRIHLPPSLAARRGSLPPSPTHPVYPSHSVKAQTEHVAVDRSRQSTSTNSSRGSLLSHSSLSSEEAIKDDDESTDQDISAEVDTPGSSSETEAMGLFTDPWARGAGKGGNEVEPRTYGPESVAVGL